MAIGSWGLAMNRSLASYQRGLEERRNYPLHYGYYKLVEVTARMQSYLNEVKTIEKHKKLNSRLPRNMSHCTREDAHVWLKRLPDVIAHRLGHDLLPSIHALHADGITASIVAQLSGNFARQTSAALYLCEKSRSTLASGIGNEYRDMREGRSNLITLMEFMVDICEDALRSVTQLKSTP
jgi:hypothetical protein